MLNELGEKLYPPNHNMSCHFLLILLSCKKNIRGGFPNPLKKHNWLIRYWAPPLTRLPQVPACGMCSPQKMTPHDRVGDGGGSPMRQKSSSQAMPRSPV
ncbi:hypothetical protein HanIR_Chr04g0162691 [Helianthus annuus]|nr:hypothetical protein HanIR_Chr04g0162691 [Helianthus annuus]